MNTSHQPLPNSLPADMSAALANFDSEAQKIINAFSQPLNSAAPPPVIYHYTNDVGLRGILETGQLWLTDIFQLNDPSELRHGYYLAINILKRKAAESPGANKGFLEEFIKFLDGLGQPGGILESGNYFICSFSRCGNDLGQWRSYADNGRGYALGFAAEPLIKAFMKQGQANTPFNATFPIIYSDQQLADMHRKIIEYMYGLISLPFGKNLGSAVAMEYWTQLAHLFMAKILLVGLWFKHEAYNNESEYRFLEIHRHGLHTKLRMRSYSLIRYREFDWKASAPEALEKIVVGPAADTKCVQFAKDCLQMFLPKNVEVRPSGIPYRAV